jgi:cytochrome subunit of sulfide dehydrogenase
MRLRPVVFAACAAGLLALAPASRAQDTVARSLAATCANCHGTNGVSRGEVVSLAGMPVADLTKAFADFRTGSRPATIMHQIAKGYTDEQVRLIAAWFAAQPKP